MGPRREKETRKLSKLVQDVTEKTRERELKERQAKAKLQPRPQPEEEKKEEEEQKSENGELEDRTDWHRRL